MPAGLIDFVQVDAFADRPFTGNPAAVVITDTPLADALMQQIAMEMNLSETAFLVPGADAWSLRWFTPETEVDLCGHATLASAHVLGLDDVQFATRSGHLRAWREGGRLWLDFPALPPTPSDLPSGLTEALGARPAGVFTSRFDLLVEFASAEQVVGLAPDHALLASIPARGVIVTAAGGAGDFTSRFFAPNSGITEDPVTGSAHCVLGPFWAARLGRSDLVGHQASRRGGFVEVHVRGDRVHLGGQATTVARGQLLI